jgi:peptide/nickel transport system permease protein
VLSPSREAWRVFRKNKAAMLGLVLLVVVILTMALGPTLYPVPPFDIVGRPFTGPFETSALPLGSDYLGRDILAGMVVGGRATVAVGLAAAAITVTIGLMVGALAGYYGGWVDEVLSRFTEIFQVMPSLLFAMVLMTLFQPSLLTAVLAIGMVTWTSTARLARAEFMRLRKLEYVNAARALGASHLRLMVREILMSWGLMIGSNRKYVLDAWWAVTFPGFAIFLTVLAVSLVGDGLNDALNPKLHQR